ncbi:MAG: lipopolysaccharide core heptose(II) kinase RfaY [Cetobacterium sp.]
MLKEKYKNFMLSFFEEKYLNLGKDIIDKNYIVVTKLKDTPRNFVAIIQWNGKKYVLKEPRNEYRIPQRQFFSFFKNGESLSTLKNIHCLRNQYGFKEYIPIFIAGTMRKNGFIVNSFFVMEYVEGTIKNDSFHKNKAIELMKKIHSAGFYHGDCNPSNFLFDKKNNIYILDTKGSRGSLFSRYYDMITMQFDSYKEMTFPYPKNIWYRLALWMKLIKRNPLLEKIKFQKKKLRDKGWKI